MKNFCKIAKCDSISLRIHFSVHTIDNRSNFAIDRRITQRLSTYDALSLQILNDPSRELLMDFDRRVDVVHKILFPENRMAMLLQTERTQSRFKIDDWNFLLLGYSTHSCRNCG